MLALPADEREHDLIHKWRYNRRAQLGEIATHPCQLMQRRKRTGTIEDRYMRLNRKIVLPDQTANGRG